MHRQRLEGGKSECFMVVYVKACVMAVSLWEVSLWACSLLYEPHLQDADKGPSPSVLCAPGEGDAVRVEHW